jgi:hypothetical protein
MFTANGDAIAVNATGVEIIPGGRACIHRRCENAVFYATGRRVRSLADNARQAAVTARWAARRRREEK